MKHIILIVIALSIVTGLLFEQLGNFVDLTPFLISFIIFINFLELEIKLKTFQKKELILSLSLLIIVMPLLTVNLFSIGLIEEFRIGLFFISLAPTGVIALIIGKHVHNSDSDMLLANFFFSNLAFVVYMPILAKLILKTDIEFSSLKLLYQTATMILIPFIASILFIRYLPKNGLNKMTIILKKLVPALLFIVISIPVSTVSKHFEWTNSFYHITSMVALVYMTGGALAFFLGKLIYGDDAKNTLAFLGSTRNNQLVLGIAIINFPPLVIVPIVLGIIIHHVTNMFWLWVLKK